jgi:hypothetical protein
MTKDQIRDLIKSEGNFEIDIAATKAKNPKLTGIRFWWDYNKSKKISSVQKNRISRILKSKISPDGILFVVYKKHPTVEKNKKETIAIMTRLVAHALKEDDQGFAYTRNSIPSDILAMKKK